MKKTKFSEAQIAFILKQAADGTAPADALPALSENYQSLNEK